MNKLEQAARQALEALETAIRPSYQRQFISRVEAITALREALAEQAKQAEIPEWVDVDDYEEQKQEPVAVVHNTDTPSNWSIIKPGLPAGTKLYAAPIEPMEQKPVAWLSEGGDVSRSKKLFDDMGFKSSPLYTAPVRTKDLTDDEITAIVSELDSKLIMRDATELEIARAVIAADREKNK